MVYKLEDFAELRKRLTRALKDQHGEPLSCRFYDCDGTADLIHIMADTDSVIGTHIAEACNIAGLIAAVERVLSLPKSNVACAELSEIFLLSLDVLREYIRAASSADRYQETEADLAIRAWAGFIKHPKDYIFAHRCLSDIQSEADSLKATINTSFLKSWDGLRKHEKDANKADLAHRIVTVELPSVDEISDFFNSCGTHLQSLVNSRVLSASLGSERPGSS